MDNDEKTNHPGGGRKLYGKQFTSEYQPPNRGRPKGSLNLSTRIRRILEGDEELPERVINTIRQYCGSDKVALDALIMAATMYAVAGDKGWADLLLKYGWGSAEPGSKMPAGGVDAAPVVIALPPEALQKALAELNGEI